MLSKRLKLLRLDKKMTQETLADELNISRSSYSKYETGIIVPDLNTTIKLANFYGVSLDYICGLTELRDNIYKDEVLCRYLNICTKTYYEFFNNRS